MFTIMVIHKIYYNVKSLKSNIIMCYGLGAAGMLKIIVPTTI